MKGLDLDLPLEEARAISNDKIIKEIEYFQRDYAPAEPAGDIEPTLRATVVQLSERSQRLEHYLRAFPKLIVLQFKKRFLEDRLRNDRLLLLGMQSGTELLFCGSILCRGWRMQLQDAIVVSREEYQFLVALSLELSLSCLFLDPAYN